MELRKFIKTTIREYLNEQQNNEYNLKDRYLDKIKTTELEKYIKDITACDDDDGIIYSGSYGKSGSLAWVNNGEIITVNTIDSGNQKDSSGTMAIASLFLLYPKVKTFTYQDHSHFDDGTSFWVRIGGDYTDLERSSFFKYFEKKYGYNPDIR